MTTINQTTRTFARHSRPTGTQYASAFEHQRRSDKCGIVIVLAVAAPIVAAFVGHLLGALL